MSGFNFFDMLGWSPLSPRINWPPYDASGGVIQPWMRDDLVGGGGDDAQGQPPVVVGTGSGPGGMMTKEEYDRSRAVPPAAPEGPVPRSLDPSLYKPLDLRSTMPDPAAPAPAPAPPPAAPPPAVPGAPPGMPGVAPLAGQAKPAVPGVFAGQRPGLGGILGIFGGGGGMTGPDGKELTTDQLMDRLLRMQLQKAMQPNWGAMAAAFAEAGKPSLLPTGGMGAALGKAAGAMSAAEGGGKDAMSIMKTMAEVSNLRSEQAARAAVAPAIAKFQAAYDKWAAGGKIGPPPTPPGGAGTSLVAGGAIAGKGGGPSSDELHAFAGSIGASPNEAALLTSAAANESSNNPTARHDGGIGYGLFGHNGSRLAAMRDQYGNAPSWQDQVKFALAELRSRPEGASINSLKTPEELTEAQMRFEQPNRKINDGNFAGRLATTRLFMRPAQVASAETLPEVPGFAASLGGVTPATTEGSGGGIPYMTAADAGGGGDDSGEPNLVTPPGGILGAAGRSAPIPGLMVQDRQPPPAPPVAPPPAAGPPAGAPFMPQGGPPPSGQSFMPQNIPQPDTAATQALMAQLAALRAATVAAKIGDPFAAYETLLTQSPQYIREKIGTEAAAKLPYQYLEPGANPALAHEIERQKQLAQYYGPQYNIALQQALGLTAQAGKDMGVITENGFVPIQGYGTAMADRAAQAEQAKQRSLVDPYGLSPSGGAPPAPQVPPGPGYSEPVETKRGTVLPPRAAQAPLTGSIESLKHQQTGPDGWVATENNWNTNLRTLREVRQTALSVADIMKHYETGAFAGQLSDFKAKAKALGIAIPDSVIQNDPAQAQKIIKENFSQTIKSLKGFDSNPAVYQIKLAFENWANTNLQPGANQAILAKAVGTADATEAMVQDWADAKRYGWVNPIDFERVWGAQNQLQSFVDKATKQIGPLKGMPQEPQQNPNPRRLYWNPATQKLEPR